MPTLLPKDSDYNIIPAVRLKAVGAHSIVATSATTLTSDVFSAHTLVVSLYATSPVYVKFSDSCVTDTTSDHYVPSGVYYDFAIGGGAVSQYGYVAALCVSDDGVLYI